MAAYDFLSFLNSSNITLVKKLMRTLFLIFNEVLSKEPVTNKNEGWTFLPAFELIVHLFIDYFVYS